MTLKALWVKLLTGFLGTDWQGSSDTTVDPTRLVRTAVDAVIDGIWTAGEQVVVPDAVAVVVPASLEHLLAKPRLKRAVVQQINKDVTTWVENYGKKQFSTHSRRMTIDRREITATFSVGDLLTAKAGWQDTDDETQRAAEIRGLRLVSNAEPELGETVLDVDATQLDDQATVPTPLHVLAYANDARVGKVVLAGQTIRVGRSSSCSIHVPQEFTRISGVAVEVIRGSTDAAEVRLLNRNGAWHDQGQGAPVFIPPNGHLTLAVGDVLYLTNDHTFRIVIKDIA